MPFPENIDFDRIANIALDEIGKAINNWLRGKPSDEVALMNHITGNLSRNRRTCDVGVQSPIKMTSKVAILHRKGPKQTDRYGADLALTVTIAGHFTKTALFQFKKCNNFKATLEKHQIEDALAHPLTKPRSFIFAVDEERQSIRISLAQDREKEMKEGQDTTTFDCSSWKGITQWLWEWLSCELSPVSDTNSTNSIEALLQQFVVGEEDLSSAWGRQVDPDSLANFPSIRAWMLLLFFNPAEQSSPEIQRSIFDIE